MKELFIKEVTTKMADFLDDNQRIKLREILIEICLNYEIEIKEQAKCKETQKNNEDILKRFISAKEIEGCSTRTLNYYKDNINKVHPHKFRRTMATMAIDKGMPIEQVQKLLGHIKIDTTMHYAMVNQNNVKISHRKYIG